MNNVSTWLCLTIYVQVKIKGDDIFETSGCVTEVALTSFAVNWLISFSTMSDLRNAKRAARVHRDHTRLTCRRKSISVLCPGQPQGAMRCDVAVSAWVSTGVRNQCSPWTGAHFHQLRCNHGTSCSDFLFWAILCPYMASLQTLTPTRIPFCLYI